MPQGTFNVSRLIAELGLQQIKGDEMRVLETIQPVMNVGALSDVTPPHVAPSAMFGGFAASGPGVAGTVQLQCLAAGGGFIEWLTIQSTTTAVSIRVLDTPITGMTPFANAGRLSRDPVVSIAAVASIAALGGSSILLDESTNFFSFQPRSLFVPRGSSFVMQGSAGAGILFFFGFGWREVPASEHVPS